MENQATPIKLNSGDWGVKIQSEAVQRGEQYTVHTKSGKSWEVTIITVIWSGKGISICSSELVQDRRMGSGHGQAAPVRGYASYCTDRHDCGCYDCAS